MFMQKISTREVWVNCNCKHAYYLQRKHEILSLRLIITTAVYFVIKYNSSLFLDRTYYANEKVLQGPQQLEDL